MRSSRDTYGIKTLRAGRTLIVKDKTTDLFRRSLARYYERHEWTRRKLFRWRAIEGGIEIERVR